MRKLLFLVVMGLVIASCSSGKEEINTPTNTAETTVRGAFIDGVPHIFRNEGTLPFPEMVGKLADNLSQDANPEFFADAKQVLTDKELNALSPSQQARLTGAVKTAGLAESGQSEVDTAFEYLMWLSDLASPEFAVETLEEDADLKAFLLSDLTSDEVDLLPLDVQRALR